MRIPLRSPHQLVLGLTSTAAISAVAVASVLALTAPALAAGSSQAKEGLGTATRFAVLGGSEVTNTGPSQISGNVGVSPQSSITGFPPATVTNGTIHTTDAVAASAQADAATAYGDLAGRTPATVESADLGGMTLKPGVYSGPTLSITGTLTLDAEHNPDAVFIFQAGTSLDAAVNSSVVLLNGASACNVFWQVGSSATLHTGVQFVGTVLAGASITADTGAAVQGRLLANAAVTLDDNAITRPACTTYPAGPVPVASPAPTSAAPTSTGPTSTAPTSTGPTSTVPTSGAPSTVAPSSGAGATGSTTSPTATQAPTSDTAGTPVATGLSPATGPSAGGTAVIVRGRGFQTGHTTVTMGGTSVPAGSVSVLSSTQLTFTTPAHHAGKVQLTFTTTHGRSNRLTYTFTTTTTSLTTTTTAADTGTPTARLLELAALMLVAGYALMMGARKRTIGRHRP